MALSVALTLAALLAGACDSTMGPSPPATITVGAAGVVPREIRIKRFDHVTFINNDTRVHNMVSDPINVHTQCPEVNRVGLLQPGESRDTFDLDLTGVCGFHDHLNQSDATLKGRIIVE